MVDICGKKGRKQTINEGGYELLYTDKDSGGLGRFHHLVLVVLAYE